MRHNLFLQLTFLTVCLFALADESFSQNQTSTSSFKIRHTSTVRIFQSRKAIQTRDNATVIVGKWGTTEDGADLLVMKLNERGEVLWSKRTEVGMRLDEYEVTELSDGSLVFVGNSQHNSRPPGSDMLVIKFTCQGDVVWSRNLSMLPSVPHAFLTPYSIKEGKNKDVVISFYSGGSGTQYTVVCRVNSLGSLVWSKTFYGSDGQRNLPSVAFFAGDKIVVLGFKSLYQNSFLYDKSFFAMKLNYDSGNMEDVKGYSYSEFITNYGVLVTHPKNHFYAEQLSSGGFALFGVFSNFNTVNAYYFKLTLNADLSIAKSNAFSVPTELGKNWSRIKVFPNGQTHIVSAVYDFQRFYWYAEDDRQTKLREQKTIYPNTYIDLRYAAMQSGTNRSMYVLSTMSTTTPLNGTIEMVQTEDNDTRMLPCLGVDTSFVKVLPWQAFSGSMQWPLIKDNEATLTALPLSSSAVSVTSQYSCEPLSSPSSAGPGKLTIKGEKTICSSGAAQAYTARTGGQPAAVQWALDRDENASLNVVNDSTVSVIFHNGSDQPKQVKLYASVGTCAVTAYSLQITVFPTYQKMAGRVNTCNLPFTLDPGSWFENYVWQDGSTNSTFTVRQPGLYHVVLTDACGNTIKDTLLVNAAPAALLSAGPDRTKCNNDTLQLSATAGFLSYSWSNNYNISSLTTQNVVVNPLVDTAYFVKAEIRPGCFAYDTVRVFVYKSPPIDLGRDTSFCKGDSLVLNAGVGFDTYTWNNGSANATLTVRADGIYSITATTRQGCKSRDTLRVLRLFGLPVVGLDKTPSLCLGQDKVLDAGAFASYRWQDGSTARTFTVQRTGVYYVTVADQNGCRASDTTIISSVNPTPKGFLPADTAICGYGNLELKPFSSFQRYLWGTGSTAASLSISQPGLYWLEVQDRNNCYGKDSILVRLKDCPTGVYVPAAFTPNGDGKNDVFRPLVLGRTKQYAFTVYNRWGQVVFQTSEVGKGWNGKVAGTPQESNVFIWTCLYQLEGDKLRSEKGTVTLIR